MISQVFFSFQYVTFRSWNAAGNVNCPVGTVPQPSAVTAHRSVINWMNSIVQQLHSQNM